MSGAARVLIVDDHPLMREGMSLAIRACAPNLIVDTAETIAGALAMITTHRGYRLVLLDLMMPDANGFSGFLDLQHRLDGVPIAIISAKHDPDTVSVARALGAAAYLPKTQPLEELVAAITRIMAGKPTFPETDEPTNEVKEAQARISRLSHAQLRVLLALANGRLNKQVAGDLGVTEATIKAHLTAIFRKLGVNNRTQAILAMQPLLATKPGVS